MESRSTSRITPSTDPAGIPAEPLVPQGSNGDLGTAEASHRRDVPDPPDDELVRAAVGGSRPAFDQLIVRYQRQAVAVSYRLLGNTPDALEVTQDAFLKAYRSLSTLQTPAAFGGWLLRIVSNLSLNYRRGRKNRRSLSLDDLLDAGGLAAGGLAAGGLAAGGLSAGGLAAGGPAGGDPSRLMQGRELGEKLAAALKELPEKQRQALLMFTVDGLPQKDVADALQCSVEAVKWHVFQGRKRLKEILKQQLED